MEESLILVAGVYLFVLVTAAGLGMMFRGMAGAGWAVNALFLQPLAWTVSQIGNGLVAALRGTLRLFWRAVVGSVFWMVGYQPKKKKRKKRR
ncbi:hypothetical protein COU20_01870 [Candidatus Kaiserbacteria bacterium CG10_big_fil_rev_8_21_14_0_10_59_10]|uniref:Uncharacterized protein n=1 Tax=Candidatus Kaiserbacteria bacterium CG10_big_fil_rev_8_21_14_0_10_59_10 TaxID=1974612 RepID=A0A2H0U7Y6_9BACT|nr:MAG: hypothetical protein COU20_01870 [Candidatus Kaiserbacteria bacterium CG10_big_fil_rev_8_21_14_0_10_59_10]